MFKKRGYKIKAERRECKGCFKILNQWVLDDDTIYMNYSKACKALQKKLKKFKKDFKNDREVVFEEHGSGCFRMIDISERLETVYSVTECGIKLK